MTDVEMDDTALAQAIAAAEEAVNARTTLARLKAERQRRDAQTAREAAERDALRLACETELAEAERDRDLALDALQHTPDLERSPAQLRTARDAWRRAFSRAHDLYHALHGDRRFYRPYALPDVFLAMREKLEPIADEAWQAKVARLGTLMGPRATRIGNGG